jgi:hypothetical protein
MEEESAFATEEEKQPVTNAFTEAMQSTEFKFQ